MSSLHVKTSPTLSKNLNTKDSTLIKAHEVSGTGRLASSAVEGDLRETANELETGRRALLDYIEKSVGAPDETAENHPIHSEYCVEVRKPTYEKHLW